MASDYDDDDERIIGALGKLEHLRRKLDHVHEELNDLQNERMILLKRMDMLRAQNRTLTKIMGLADQMQSQLRKTSPLYIEYTELRHQLDSQIKAAQARLDEDND